MSKSKLSREVLIDIYRRMTLIKQNDERFVASIKAGDMAIAYYSPRGQEAISACMSVHLRPEDYIVTIYRGLHDHLAKGVPLRELWAEFAGKVGGTCKGKGGPMHITHPESGVMVTTGIVGAGLPIANGLALSSKLRGDGRVTVSNFGDGASNIGAFHEALNLASLWKLPVIFLCHNNRYAEHTSYEFGTSVESVAKRADAYNMPGIKVDGNDPLKIHEACRVAVERARSGGGPTLIEAMTFRFRGHNFGDSGHYIPKEEYEEALQNDPVPKFRKWLIDEGHSSEQKLHEIESAIEKEIDDAVVFMRESPYPPLEEMGRDVFATEVTP